MLRGRVLFVWKNMPDLEVIVPVLNEQDSVQELVQRTDKALKSVGLNYGLVFVDDHSTDNTVKRIKALQSKYPIVLHIKRGSKGKAQSILEGAKLAKAKTLAMIDGDLQYPPEVLPEMYELSKKFGVVVANRKKEKISRIRRVGSDASTGLVGKLLLGFNCDAQSGLKVFRKEVIDEIEEGEVKPWALDMPLLHTARDMGHKIGTVEVEFARRVNGHSKVKFVKTAIEITSTALRLKFKKSKTRPINSTNGTMLGAGIIHKRKRFITHTTLAHKHSAVVTLAPWQKVFLFSLIAILVIGIALNPLLTLIGLVGVLSLIYFLDVLFSMVVLLKSLHFPPELKFSDRKLRGLQDKNLPIYTVLCPLYKEGRVLPDFIKSIKNIDWPKDKLEVLLLLEEDDDETLAVAKELKLPSFVKVLIVPDSQPRTKPKACNFGLAHARGEYVVVYDAEDKPEPLQLKKAYLGFKKLGKKVFCLQSKLNYFNPDHNILTRLFTAEYSLWFDVILPGLQSIEASIPLGGTSNHFRTRELIALHAWDPFNVTEDCDLGVRIFKSGGKTAIIDSTTYEEANSSMKNWIRQRSRWIKGYMQTYLVHMREPVSFFRTHGIHALIFQLVIGMRMTFMLINPFLWVMTIAYFAFRSTIGASIEALYPGPIFYIAAFALVSGNFMYIYNYMIGCAKRGHWGLVKFVFFIPLYWVLASVAAFKAIHQLIVKPHFWEKTNHGLHLPYKKEKKFLLSPDYGFSGMPGSFLSTGFLLVAAAILANFLNFVTSIYLGRTLDAEEFGLISLMTGFLFIAQIPSGGIGQTITHQTAFLYGKLSVPPGGIWRKYRSKFVLVSLLFTLVWVTLTPVLMDIFNAGTAIPFIVFAPMWMILILGSLSGGFLGGSLRFRLLALLITVESVAKLIFSILLIEANLSLWVYTALPLSLLVSLLLSWFLVSRLSRENTKETALKLIPEFPKKFFAVSILVNLSTISFLSLDLLFVKHFMSAVEAGRYALLVLVGRMVYMTGALFSQFILPIVSKEEGANSGQNKAFLKLLLAVIFSTSVSFIVVGPLGGFTVPVLFGDKAAAIVPYLVPFTLSMILFSVAVSIVAYHQAKREYLFAFPGVAVIPVMAVGLYLFHGNISEVVNVMLASGMFFLGSAVFLHFSYNKVIVPLSNIYDFFGLFLLKLNGRHSLPGGNLRILVYNWRDIKHVWAGGAEVYVHELAKRWVKAGHKVTLFCGNDGNSQREEEIDGIKIIRRGGFYTVYLWAFLYYLIHFRRRYDVVIESENGVPFFTPLYSTKPKVLIVHHVHQEVFRSQLRFPLSTIARLIESKLMPFVYRGKTIVAVSESTKKEVAKTGIARANGIHIVSPGVDVSKFYKSSKTEYPSFIYLGRHKAYKNIDIAIKAFRKVVGKYPDARLTIAGEGELTKDLKSLVEKLKLDKSVVFTGKVSEEEKVRLLGKCWAALQPSSFEGWGITVIEANACGTPVVASRVNGLRDSVVDGKTGLLVLVKNVAAFAKGMNAIAENNDLRKNMSIEAFKWARSHDWQGRAGEFMEVINGIMEKKGEVLVGDLTPSASYSYEEK